MTITSSAVTRRTVVAGLCATGLATPAKSAVQAESLTIRTRTLDVKGRAATVYGIFNGRGRLGFDGPVGQRFAVRLANETQDPTLLHWHGLTPPYDQDGVPEISQPPLPSQSFYDYDFENRRAGTFWMHSHLGLQEQALLAAPLILRETERPLFDQLEHVVMLHDFTFRPATEILAELQAGGGGHAAHAAMGQDRMDHSGAGHAGMRGVMTMPESMTNETMSMLNDITYDAYLANDRTLDDPDIVTVEPAMSVRLRIINACSASNMWVDLGDMQAELIAVDGNAVIPVPVRRLPLAIAQRADIRVKIPAGQGAWPILFRPEGVWQRTGIILATKGATVTRVAVEGETAPALDLDLEALLRFAGTLPEEPVARTERLMLTGGDADYRWGLNGKFMQHETLFTVRSGERIDVMMHNMTMMAHPMHLHGHYFKVVAIDGVPVDGALRDTVLVPPGRMVTIRFDADNPGIWPFHCHHLYHMNSGMMGMVRYTDTA